MERLSDRAIEIINELHTERLDYNSEYLPLIDAANKLGLYEDLGLEPSEVSVLCDMDRRAKMAEMLRTEEKYSLSIDRIKELVEADREGRCVVLPVKEGDTVYCITWNPFEDDPPEIFDCAFHITDYYSIGRTVFLTEEEAEKAIEKMKASENDG